MLPRTADNFGDTIELTIEMIITTEYGGRGLAQLFPDPDQFFHLGSIVATGEADAHVRRAAGGNGAEPVHGGGAVAGKGILLGTDLVGGTQVISLEISIQFCVRFGLIVIHRNQSHRRLR